MINYTPKMHFIELLHKIGLDLIIQILLPESIIKLSMISKEMIELSLTL